MDSPSANSIKADTTKEATRHMTAARQEEESATLRNAELYSTSSIAKIWGIALRGLLSIHPPVQYPEYTRPGGGDYTYSGVDFWTSGFFPGSLALIKKRRAMWPHSISLLQPDQLKLQQAFEWWTENLHRQANRVDTHDLGFMIQPWAQIGWELDHDIRCRDSLVVAAYSLASRFDERLGAIRSWNTCVTKRYSFQDPSKDFLVIIDNLMNLDLLFYVSNLTGDPLLARIAASHALTTAQTHIRLDHSTYHVVNLDKEAGKIKQRFTNQGYAEESCWARGQAWAIVGYAQTYGWTKNVQYLEISRSLADYFIKNLPSDFVPFWDFHAPKPGPRDTSAAMIAVYGMLLLHRHTSDKQDKYLRAALRVLDGVLSMSLSQRSKMGIDRIGNEMIDFAGHETILLNATINNYEHAPHRWADHGLVYADYYFLLVGNMLLEMGVSL